MAIPGQDAVIRFQENEERFQTFLNETGTYTTDTLEVVETLPSLALTIAGMTLTITDKGAWLTGTSYARNDVVSNADVNYICAVAHIAGTFATDLGAAKWLVYNQVLAADLASVAVASKGAGQVGFSYALAYGANTIGKWLKDLASSVGAGFIGYLAPLTGAVLRTLLSKNSDIVSVNDFGADPTGATSSNVAFALASLAAIGRALHLNGDYKLTSEWTCNGIHSIIGEGSNNTTITFAPTADGSCLKLADGVSQVVRPTIKGIAFYSADLTYAKVAIDIYDVSSCTIDDIYIHGAGVGTPSAPYWSGGTGSIGLRTHGREVSSFSNMRICADYPIYIAANPNTSAQILEDVDHFNFRNLYLVGLGHYCVTVADGLGVSNMVFDGYQAWVGGTGGLYINDTRVAGGGYISSRNIVIKNVRTEQITDANGWAFNLNFTSGCQQLAFENIIMSATSKGINLNKITRLSLRNVTAAMSTTALVVGGAVDGNSIEMDNCFWESGSVVTLTNYVPSSIRSWKPSLYSAPSCATYTFAGTSPYSHWFVLSKGATNPTVPADTTEDTLVTITVPKNTIGPNGALRIKMYWYSTNNANAKTARVRFGGIGGADCYGANLANNLSTLAEVMIFNRNATNSQYATPTGGLTGNSGMGSSAVGPITYAVDTTADATIVITGQKATAGDTMSLVWWDVEVCPG